MLSLCTRLQEVKLQQTAIFIVTAMSTSLSHMYILLLITVLQTQVLRSVIICQHYTNWYVTFKSLKVLFVDGL